MSDIILCVTEGAQTEVKLLESLKSVFLDRPVEIICFGTSIYQLYRKVKDEDIEFLITYELLQEISQEQKGKRDDVLSKYSQIDISEIYLFFDYDGHDNLASQYPDCVKQMLNIFDNETENGKLFISYPMVEAFKHYFDKEIAFDISAGKSYKMIAATGCDNKLNNHSNRPLSKDEWSKHLIKHVKAANHLIHDNFSYPQSYLEAEQFTQKQIYEAQYHKFIDPLQKVLVISPFACFLLDYLGSSLYEEWFELDSKL